ncbi:NUDIX hydrolase domain-like protein [Tribonema minus]|uniref:NUDIX hydrolase domain-like protein n=1 Tax=Tribonema minus TaxID=303371 RepID=A0A836CD75_9STRA|nr:NUDIX hydrolase domain-like protein [Tribonema minus]
MRPFDALIVARMQALLAKQPLRLLAKEPRFMPQARRAAVLVPLCNDMGVPSILFTVRTATVPTHKGQVAFPGGHIKAGEGPVDAALRETVEEVGEGIGAVHIVGHCQTVPAVTGTRVTPVVGWVERDVDGCRRLELCPDEVAHAFTVPLAHLLDPANRGMERLGARGDMPVFMADPHRIWGLTAFITDGVLRNAVVPALAAPDARDDGEEGSALSAH